VWSYEACVDTHHSPTLMTMRRRIHVWSYEAMTMRRRIHVWSYEACVDTHHSPTLMTPTTEAFASRVQSSCICFTPFIHCIHEEEDTSMS